MMAEPGFWDNQDRARGTIDESNRLKGWIEPWHEARGKVETLQELVELLELESDAEMEAEWARELEAVEKILEDLELRTMLQGEDDARDAILTVQPGAGGLESQDWAEMLSRMYTRWAESNGFGVSVLDLQPGEEAGIKGATLEIKGLYAYGYLKAEGGVHRLVRISPYDQQAKRRHTSFASVSRCIRWSTTTIDRGDRPRATCASIRSVRAGAGGQHVNKTESADAHHARCRPGSSCQSSGRSGVPAQATATSAMRILKSRLFLHYQRAVEERREGPKAECEAAKKDIAFRKPDSIVRVCNPYTMVNDHRTELKMSDVHAVMNGALDPFIEAYLKMAGAPESS